MGYSNQIVVVLSCLFIFQSLEIPFFAGLMMDPIFNLHDRKV